MAIDKNCLFEFFAIPLVTFFLQAPDARRAFGAAMSR
jgi:hypothetical protein